MPGEYPKSQSIPVHGGPLAKVGIERERIGGPLGVERVTACRPWPRRAGWDRAGARDGPLLPKTRQTRFRHVRRRTTGPVREEDVPPPPRPHATPSGSAVRGPPPVGGRP